MATTLGSRDFQAEVTFSQTARPSVQSDSKHESFPDRSDEEHRYWPTDTDLHRLLSNAEDSDGEQAGSQSRGYELVSDPGTVLDRLIARWAEIAVSHAIVRSIDDPAGYVATVAGIEGAWGFGDSDEGALDELKSVLIGWASLKIEDGDDDIPSMEGVHLVLSG